MINNKIDIAAIIILLFIACFLTATYSKPTGMAISNIKSVTFTAENFSQEPFKLKEGTYSFYYKFHLYQFVISSEWGSNHTDLYGNCMACYQGNPLKYEIHLNPITIPESVTVPPELQFNATSIHEICHTYNSLNYAGLTLEQEEKRCYGIEKTYILNGTQPYKELDLFYAVYMNQ